MVILGFHWLVVAYKPRLLGLMARRLLPVTQPQVPQSGATEASNECGLLRAFSFVRCGTFHLSVNAGSLGTQECRIIRGQKLASKQGPASVAK